MSDSLPAGSPEPAAKRVCLDNQKVATNNIKDVMADHTADTPSILEWLNKDCFQAVLSFLTTGDILRSVEVSQQWREEVLEYLRGYRFCFEFYHVPRAHFIPRLVGLLNPEETHDRRVMPFDMCHGDPTHLGDKIERLGPAISSIVLDRLDEPILKTIAENCPNLKEFMLAGMLLPIPSFSHCSYVEPWYKQQSETMNETFAFAEDVVQCIHNMKLKRVTFLHSPIVPEKTIAEFLTSESLEEIIICRNRLVNGSCLSGIKATNLKSLRLNGCNVDLTHLIYVADRLSALTTLDLSNNPPEILTSLHLLLQRTPLLEHLMLNTYNYIDMGKELLEAFGPLEHLKHLSLCWNHNVGDEWLEIIAAGCKSLQTLDIENKESSSYRTPDIPQMNEVTARGVRALGQARALVHVGLGGRKDSVAALPAVVAGCPNLESVDVRGCTLAPQLLAALVAARAPRRAPLALRVARSSIARHDLLPEGLALNFADTPRTFRLV